MSVKKKDRWEAGVLAILEGARALIATPEQWGKGWLARTAAGKECSPLLSGAVRFCLIGALARAHYDAATTRAGDLDHAQSLVRDAIGRPDLSEWNDRWATHGAVLKALDLAMLGAPTLEDRTAIALRGGKL